MPKKRSGVKSVPPESRIQSTLTWFKTSIWAFPLLLAIPFLILVVFKIHGSSIGVYHPALYGNETKDPDLLYGTPKTIRSDEWLGWTQNNALQEETGFPAYNDKLGGDGDLTKNPDIPTKDWSTIFRPHNWSFFFLPFEHAFAFKWWFMLYALIVSCYLFIFTILPKQKLLSIILSLSFALSPFILWWYQSAIFISFAAGFLSMIVGMRIVDGKHIPHLKKRYVSDGLHVLALSFLGACLIFTIYPPYSLPVAVVVAAYLIGYLAQKKTYEKFDKRGVGKALIMFALSAILATFAILAYASQHRTMIERTAESVYPGQRASPAGDLPLLAVSDGFLMPLLQGDLRGRNYYSNQSEASNFLLLLPFLIIPGLILQCLEYRKNRRIDWVFLGIQLCALLFFVRAFVPAGDELYKLLMLDRVPNARLRAGMGFLGLVQLVLVLKKIGNLRLKPARLAQLTIPYGAICLVFLLWTGSKVIHMYPRFLDSYALMTALALYFTAIIIAFLLNKRLLGALLLLLLTSGSSFRILPLYRGLDFLQNSEVVNSIKELSAPSDRWATVDDLTLSNIPIVAGRRNISGSQNYTDFELWEQIENDKYERVYNRQARSVFISTDPTMETLKLVQPNLFYVKLECSEFVRNNVDYFLAITDIKTECTKLIKTIRYPNKHLYIHKVLDERN